MDADVRVGTVVRIELHGRRVGGWVVDDEREPPARVQKLKPIANVTGWGPPPSLVDLSSWATWRWAGPRAAFLGTASADVAVRGLPRPPSSPPPATVVVDPEVAAAIDNSLRAGGGIVRLPPEVDVASIAAHVVAVRGPSLILSPNHVDASRIALALKRQGTPVASLPRDWPAARAGGLSVVGSRAAAWAPVPDPAAILVLDAHDEAYQEERTPSWHAVDVAIERAKRARIPIVLTSPCPDLIMLAAARRPPRTLSRRDERDGWPMLDVIDRRGDDPRTGMYSERLVNLVRRAERSLLVLNRKGRARLLACGACSELARCERCEAAVAQSDDGLACGRCGLVRPGLCASCGSTALKALRVGVTRVREELEALLQAPVGEVTGDTDDVPDTDVIIGTEAVLHRVPRCDLVAFLDIDQELLAPRYRAAEEALALLARAGRLVGGRRGGGRVAVQTRLPHHEVLAAALHGDPARVTDVELPKRELLGFPPAKAMAAVSGAAAEAYVDRLRAASIPNIEVLGPGDGRWLVRAPSAATLADALSQIDRPPGRLRLEVDPRRL
jgi:primosomal protein N' (replication factor Y) (superfamily II helicase)